MSVEEILIVALAILSIAFLAERDTHARGHTFTRPEPTTLPPTELPPSSRPALWPWRHE
jgi:hypothetical protein